MSLRDAILAADDLPRVAVHVPEWGVTVYVRSMSGMERDAWEAEVFREKDEARRLANLRARLLVRCVVDESGARVFADGDAAALGAKAAAPLTRLYDAAAELNAVREKDVQDLAKNSEAPRSDA